MRNIFRIHQNRVPSTAALLGVVHALEDPTNTGKALVKLTRERER